MRAYVLKVLGTALLGTLLSWPNIGETAPFPAPLLGKSVIVSWITNRQQKFEGTDEVAFRSRGSTLSIYISTAGRAFSTEMVVRPAGGGGRGGGRGRGGGAGPTTESTQAPDESRNSTGGTRVVHFDGGALLVDNPLIAGARRVSITFDAGYGSCNARVIFGREGGTGPIRQRSILSGRRFEVISVQTSAPSCAVRPGNVFGGQ
ncbi:MAG TPA: hypothetical protein VKP67_13860 [Xanthobacteraceae bacterium]|nr:hypothetical protein [Xanthobacteraceae bacterium]